MDGALGSVASWLARLLIPTRCVLCQSLGELSLCQDCAPQLRLINSACSRCGRLRQTSFASPDCGECHGRTLGIEKARSRLVYNPAGRRLLAEFKYQRRQAAGQVLAEQMKPWLAAGADQLFQQPGIQLSAVVPVPMFASRLRRRRFNQAEFLAQRIAVDLGLPCRPELLERTRDTDTQVGKSLNQRRENVRGAFAVPGAMAEEVKGRAVLLVDDLMTTGSTLLACARALRRAGCSASYAITAFSTAGRYEPDDDVPPPVGL
ncbi:ComF family protein [bacterium]|nr:ComF family protein [bacterium]